MKIGIVIALGLVACLLLPGLATAETAPSLAWTNTFIGENPSTQTFLREAAIYDVDAGTQGCPNTGTASPNNIVQVDWKTGEVYAGLTDGKNNEADAPAGVHHYAFAKLLKLRGTTGTVIAFDSATAAYDLAMCGIALDQRGRVFEAVAPCSTTKHVPSLILRTSDFLLLKSLDQTQICAVSGSVGPTGVYVDVAHDRTSNTSRFIYLSGSRLHIDATISWDPNYTEVCRGSSSTNNEGLYFRNDGVNTPYSWEGGAGVVTEWKQDTCAAGAQNSLPLGTTCTFSAVTLTMDCFSNAFTRYSLDPTDHTTQITINSTTPMSGAPIPDPKDDGKSALALRILKMFTDTGGNYIGCGLVTASNTDATQYRFIAKWNAAWNTLIWNVTAPETPQWIDCDFGASGEIIIAQRGSGATPRAAVLKYCCAESGVAQSQYIEQFGTILNDTTESEGGGVIPTDVFGQLRSFCSDTWGFDCAWIIGIFLIGGMAVMFARRGGAGIFLAALGALLGVGLFVRIFPEFVWVLFVIVFLIMAVAGTKLFGGSEEEKEG